MADMELQTLKGEGSTQAPSTGVDFKRKMSTCAVFFMLLGDIVGGGILGLPYAFVQIGGLIGVVLAVLLAIPNLYTGWLLFRLHPLFPEATTLAHMARATCGPTAHKVVLMIMMLSWLLQVASALLPIILGLQIIFYTTPWCQYWWALIAVACVLPGNQFMSLHGLAYATVVGAITMLIVIVICVVGAFNSPLRALGDASELVATDIGPWAVFRSMSSIFYAFGGQSIYLEIISEMREPKDFGKVLIGTTIFLACIYCGVALSVSLAVGSLTPGFMPFVVEYNTWRSVMGAALVLHMIVSYTITQHVLSKLILKTFAPHLLQSRATWALLTTAVAVWAYFLSMAIPFFEDLSGFAGALLTPAIGLGLPVIFTMGALRSTDEHVREKIAVACKGCVLYTLLVATTICIVFGVYSEVSDIAAKTALSPPFACRCNALQCLVNDPPALAVANISHTALNATH